MPTNASNKPNNTRQTDPYQPNSFDDPSQFQPQPRVQRPPPLVGAAALWSLPKIMRSFLLYAVVCIGLHGSLYGEESPDRLLQEATQIVIRQGFGEPFDSATQAVARIRDEEIIQKALQSVVGKKPEEIDHYLLLPYIQVAVLNAKGQIIAAFAFDRSPTPNSGKSHAVLRIAEIIMKDGKSTIAYNSKNLLKGFPCKALEAYRFEDQESSKTKSEEAGADQPAFSAESKPEGNEKPQPKSRAAPR